MSLRRTSSRSFNSDLRSQSLLLLSLPHLETRNLEVRLIRVASNFEWFMRRAEVRRAGDGEVVVAVDGVNRYVIGKRANSVGSQEISNAHPVRKRRLWFVRAVCIATQHLQRPGRMATARVRDGSQNRVLIGNRCQAWQQLTDVDAGDVCGNRLIRGLETRTVRAAWDQTFPNGSLRPGAKPKSPRFADPMVAILPEPVIDRVRRE